jgi:demethylmenaquinone methyltransferase/2-methoxy-6-polyprenyl-1,4-benzoquinol methylase
MAPHAARELSGMFDQVSDRYDFLNRVLSLGQDRAWREAMWSRVPESARTVLDLCTGTGTSLDGLRQPGRLVLGIDVSVEMLRIAKAEQRGTGWAPRLVCADGFHLPLPDHSIDAITVAFGVRNLRPRRAALEELRRVLVPGGSLIVLEATAPDRGLTAPFHRFYLRHVVPFAGRLSRDPSAYAYLGHSILDFGSGRGFDEDLAATGYSTGERRSFLLGATRLWVSHSKGGDGQSSAALQDARSGRAIRGILPRRSEARSSEWRVWAGTQLALSLALVLALLYGLWVVVNSGDRLSLAGWNRPIAITLLAGGALAFGVRSLALLARLTNPPERS